MIFCARAKLYGPAGAATILIFDWDLFVSLLIYSPALTRLPLQRGDVCYALLYSAALSSALGIRYTVYGTRNIVRSVHKDSRKWELLWTIDYSVVVFTWKGWKEVITDKRRGKKCGEDIIYSRFLTYSLN